MTNTRVSKAGIDALRSEINLSWDGDDPWGSSLSALGGLCDVLCHLGGAIPKTAGYSPGAAGPYICDYPGLMFLEMHDDGTISIGDMEYWAIVLSWFTDLVPENRRY